MSLGNRLRHLHVPALGESDISAQLRRFRDSLKLSRRDQGRILGILAGLLLAIPAVFLNFLLRFISLGCGIFRREERSGPPPAILTDPK